MRISRPLLIVVGFLVISSIIATRAEMRALFLPSATVDNSPPVAVADDFTRHGSGIIGPLMGNDHDPDFDPFHVTIVTFPTQGRLFGVVQDGNFYNYTLNVESYVGTDSFTYKVCDNNNLCSPAVPVTIIIVNQAPVAGPDSYTVHGGTTIGPMMVNDFDPDGDQISFALVTGVSHGTLTGLTQQDLKRYTPNIGYTGSDSFTYKVCDQLGLCSETTVTLNVNNTPPVAGADEYVVRGTTIIGPLFANDYDPDGDTFNGPSVVVGASHGTVYGLAYPTFPVDVKQYVPHAGYTGTDSFQYEICDAVGACTTTTVTFFVSGDGADDGVASCNARLGQPINVTNGNMYLQQSDYHLPGVGYPIDVTRTYNSNSQRIGIFGRGWSTAFDESLIVYDGSMLRLNQSDGRASYFGRPIGSSATFQSLEGDFHGQVAQNGGGFTLTMKDGSVRQFDSAGKLLSLSDRNNNTTTLAYEGNGFLASVTDPFSRVMTLTTNANGQVSSIGDSEGVIASYTYGAGNELLSVTYADNSKFTFTYGNFAGNLRLTSVTDALGNIVESHTYDGQGRALTSARHGGVELYTLNYVSDTQTDVTDALGRLTKFTIDKSKGRNLVTQVEGLCDCGSGDSQIQTWTYDDQLNVIAKTDALNHTRTFTYDANGNRLTETDATGTVTFTYNQFGEVLTHTNQMNGVTTNTYDAAGSLLTMTNALGKTTSFSYDARGLMLTATDARGKVTSFAYNSDGNLVAKTDPLNHTTQFGYDSRGRLVAVTNALNHVTLFFHDPVGRLIQVMGPDATSRVYEYDLSGRRTAMTDAKGNRSTFIYDGANRLTSETDALNQSTTYTYDLMSNLTSRTDAVSRVTNYEYDDFNRLTKTIYPPATIGATRLFDTLTYDAAGNVTARTDTAGRVTSFAYDAADRVTGSTDADNKLTSFEYDALSRTTALVDAKNQRYRFNYDAVGQLRHVRRGTTVMSFTYDSVGNRKTRTDYNGAQTDYSYDALNRLKTITYPDTTTVGYTYDKLSRLKTATNANGTIDFDYNKMDRLTSVTDVFGQVVGYNYDANGNRTKLTLNAALSATYRYDAGNRLTKIIDGAGAATNYTYGITNKLTSRRLPNGILTSYTYNGLDRLTRLLNAKATVTVSDLQYQYSTANQITQIGEPTNTRSYGYDATDRLTSANYTNPIQPNEHYGYDGVGNRTNSHLSASYGHQPFNRLVSTASATYSYDTNGNLISKADSNGTMQYVWDFENRLKQVTLPSGNIVTYKYDAFGRRIQRNNTRHRNEFHLRRAGCSQRHQ